MLHTNIDKTKKAKSLFIIKTNKLAVAPPLRRVTLCSESVEATLALLGKTLPQYGLFSTNSFTNVGIITQISKRFSFLFAINHASHPLNTLLYIQEFVLLMGAGYIVLGIYIQSYTKIFCYQRGRVATPLFSL